MIFDIEKFNNLMKERDILALGYLEPFIPKSLVDKYNAITQLNYTLTLFKSGLLKGNIYNIYIDNRDNLFRELGLEIIITGNESKFMQSKAILESEGKFMENRKVKTIILQDESDSYYSDLITFDNEVFLKDIINKIDYVKENVEDYTNEDIYRALTELSDFSINWLGRYDVLEY